MVLTRARADGVIVKATFDMDDKYFESLADEMKDEHPTITAQQIMERLADSLMDQSYYINQDNLEDWQ